MKGNIMKDSLGITDGNHGLGIGRGSSNIDKDHGFDDITDGNHGLDIDDFTGI